MRQLKQHLAGLVVALSSLGAASAMAQGVAPVLADVPLGKADAPVTVIEYASFTCPHCAHFANETFDQVKAAYIDTGKVKWIYRDFPLDEIATRASQLARCGGADRYYGFVATLFRQQLTWATQQDPLKGLAQIGKLGGISDLEFNACMNDQQVENAVLQSRLDAQKQYDVNSTPTFIINGKKYPGALPIEDLSKILDALLPASAQAAPAAPPAASAPSAAAPSTPAAPTTPMASDSSTMTWIIGGIVVLVAIAGAGVMLMRRKSTR
jgi:protein-disulfide isomerase